MKTKNIDATRINVTQICYYFIKKTVNLNKIILLRCKLVIGFSFFLVHFLTQKVWAEKICIHFHAKGDLPFLGGETATIQTWASCIYPVSWKMSSKSETFSLLKTNSYFLQSMYKWMTYIFSRHLVIGQLSPLNPSHWGTRCPL